ncbi:MAG: hypothetical protein HQ526_09165 [Actinobacteria bacterium]|nr:hypothetical protein [Actinomycetota bacterium]
MATMVPAAVKRPASVTFAVVVVWIYAILTIGAGIAYLVIAFNASARNQAVQEVLINEDLTLNEAQELVTNARNVFIIVALVTIVIGLFAAFAASGLGKGKNGWRVFVLIIIFLRWIPEVFEIRAVDSQVSSSYDTTWGGVIGNTVFFILVIFLLFNRKANVFFAQRDQQMVAVAAPMQAPQVAIPPMQPPPAQPPVGQPPTQPPPV